MAKSAYDNWYAAANSRSIRSDVKVGDLAGTPLGYGSTTAQLSNPGTATTSGAVIGDHSAPWAQPVPVWVGLIVLVFLWKYVEKHQRAGDVKAGSIELNLHNFAKFWIMLVIVSNVSKWIFSSWKLPGISALALAA